MSDAPTYDTSESNWCYHCNKRVNIETLQNESIVCTECNKGFVESIPEGFSSPTSSPPPPLSPDLNAEDSTIGSHFLQMLRMLAHAPLNQSRASDSLSYEDEDDFFRLEDADEEEEEEEEEGESVRSRTGRNRILDWAEILMGIEDDTAGYEALLQNLDGGGGGRRGALPAAKSVIESLENFEIIEEVCCAVCKDGMVKGEIGKKLPCGHCYHEYCIVPWLGTRNSCPVCRFQLRTDDVEYEEERKKCNMIGSSSSGDSGL